MRSVTFLFFFLLFSFSYGKPVIYTTVKPIADIILEITGSNVHYIIPPGVSPHIYEIKFSSLKGIYNADLFVYIGSGEPHMKGLLQSIPEEKKVRLLNLKGLHIIEDEDHHHKHPAIWLDPENAITIAKHIEKKLEKIDPKNREEYRRRLDTFVRRVKEIKNYGIEKFKKLKNRKFISYHYAWPYFTQAFHLEYAGVIEMGHGREPTPGHIMSIINTIKKYRIKTIFASKQFYNKKYISLIKNSVDVKVVFLDPFGIDRKYIDMMRYNIDMVYKGLSQ
ncbi:zinc ABC transporter substrate-binding protein [Persephonella atlantica]|uniref:Zinc ABC transporter substrate-binding protein n=1 Tax=Persephonella atlantica TaxID=2699429 RepID=A0ABS1GF26_9AQUI|nr:metal ABC transporter substrate-binding protein [Persephonella atlantica]MBK3331490.1 zinc ABC transporter substrate-binding protein [Persephonella atlantica]